MKKIPFYRHNLGEAEIREIRKVLRGPILTTGAQVAEFEERFSNFLGCRDTVACTSWTGAAHIALLALGIRPGDEVITSPLTFVATATAIIQAGAIPRFVDCEQKSGNLDPRLIEIAITEKTKAIMPVHLYGRMCDMRAIYRIAVRHKLKVVEDAAHCVEGRRDGVKPAQLSHAACFSFFATKNLACGEGGAVSFNNPALSLPLRRLRLHGVTKTSQDREKEGYSHWDMPAFGWKYNMDNIHGAILLAQMRKFPTAIQHRQASAKIYREMLKEIPKLELLEEEKNGIHARHLMPILTPKGVRDRVIQELRAQGVQVMVNYRPIHRLSFFRKQANYRELSFPNAEEIGNRVISLPFYPGMSKVEISHVCKKLSRILK